MGLIVDTVVFVAFERSGQRVDLSPWEPLDEVFISAVTVSELLVGVHLADTESRRATARGVCRGDPGYNPCFGFHG